MGASKGGFRGSSKYFLKERGTGYVNGRLEDDSNFIVARHVDPEMVSKEQVIKLTICTECLYYPLNRIGSCDRSRKSLIPSHKPVM